MAAVLGDVHLHVHHESLQRDSRQTLPPEPRAAHELEQHPRTRFLGGGRAFDGGNVNQFVERFEGEREV